MYTTFELNNGDKFTITLSQHDILCTRCKKDTDECECGHMSNFKSIEMEIECEVKSDISGKLFLKPLAMENRKDRYIISLKNEVEIVMRNTDGFGIGIENRKDINEDEHFLHGEIMTKEEDWR